MNNNKASLHFKSTNKTKHTLYWDVTTANGTYTITQAEKTVLEIIHASSLPISASEIKEKYGNHAASPIYSLVKKKLIARYRKRGKRTFFHLFIDGNANGTPKGYDKIDETTRRQNKKNNQNHPVPKPISTQHKPSPFITNAPYISPSLQKQTFDTLLAQFENGSRHAFERATLIIGGTAHPNKGRWVFVGAKTMGCAQNKPDQNEYQPHPKSDAMLVLKERFILPRHPRRS